MVAQPESVPAARHFVDRELTRWGCDDLVEDVGLCVSELATNATLHSGSTYFHLELERRDETVSVAVADAGTDEVDVLARQPELSDAFVEELGADEASATGRGMFLVSVLASTWGIDELPAGKRVWAEFPATPPPPGQEDGEPQPTAARVSRSPDRRTPALDPAEFAVVRLLDCPAALLIAHDDKLAEYTRELQLIGDRKHELSLQRLGEVLAGYVASHATNWDAARLVAHQAVRDGRDLVDIDVLVSANIRESVRLLRGLIAEVESLSRDGRLMTLPAAEPVQRLRDWLEGEFLAQAEDRAEPLPYSAWLAGARR